MIASLLAVAVFAYFWIVGLGLVNVLSPRRQVLRNILIGPAVGFAGVSAVAVFLNFFGMPAERFAWPLFGISLFGALLSLSLVRVRMPWRLYTPFAAVLGLGFVLNALPLFKFGFNWVSISNDDADTYALSAFRLLHQGYWSLPPQDVLLYDTNPWARFYYHYSQFPGGIYHSFDLTLAMVSRITGIDTFGVYMPVMVAGLLILISSCGALLLRKRLGYLAPWLASVGVACSALLTLGFMHQLGPQEFSHSQLVVCAVLFMDRLTYVLKGKRLIGTALLCALGFAGLALTYGAYFAMLIPAVAVYLILGLARRQIKIPAVLKLLALAGAFGAVLLNAGTRSLLNGVFVSLAYSGGHLYNERASFPFYVVPSGLANFWNLYPIAHQPGEPWLSLGIAVGAVLTLVGAAASAWVAWKGIGAGIITAAVFGMLGIAAAERGDFALFKLSMYIQPFLWPTLVAASFLAAAIVVRKRRGAQLSFQVVAVAPILVLIVFSLGALHFYIQRSEDVPGVNGHAYDTSFVTLSHPSSDRLIDQLKRIRDNIHTPVVIMDSDSHALISYEGYYLYGRPNFAPSGNMQRLFDISDGQYILKKPILGRVHWDRRALAEAQKVQKLVTTLDFNFTPGEKKPVLDAFSWYRILDAAPLRGKAVTVLVTTPRLTVLNRRRIKDESADVVARPLNSLQNHLVLMNGLLGIRDVTSDFRNAALYDMNDDYFFPGKGMSAAGRYLLFFDLNASKPVRLVLNMTGSLDGNGRNTIPPAYAVGTKRLGFGAAGSGSARLFSPPIMPQVLNGRPFIGIDMGSDGFVFPNVKTGLMKLYGTNQGGDPRRIVAFVRDISALSEHEYDAMRAPEELHEFPADLEDPDLEYSGIYEDGWVSESAFAVLRATRSTALVVNGEIPMLGNPGFTSRVTVLVDGKPVVRRTLSAGAFTLTTVAEKPGNHRIGLKFSGVQSLPGGDRRPVGAKLQSIGFTP